MDDDLIVVDDPETMETQAGPSTLTDFGSNLVYNSTDEPSRPKSVAEHSIHSGRSTRSASNPPMQRPMESSDRTTRSASAKFKPHPKLKLKLSEKTAAQAPGMSFLGPYDRELDSDDEDLAFEEQFILRMPPGEDLEKLRKMVAAREVTSDVWFKFKGRLDFVIWEAPLNIWTDSRRAAFHIGNSTYSAKLVDLPCIVESQKTLDNKQMFKVADICQVEHSQTICFCLLTLPRLIDPQMLVVGSRVGNDEPVSSNRTFNIEEFIWPHGTTPPLHHVRKRRFRKRVNRRVCPRNRMDFFS